MKYIKSITYLILVLMVNSSFIGIKSYNLNIKDNIYTLKEKVKGISKVDIKKFVKDKSNEGLCLKASLTSNVLILTYFVHNSLKHAQPASPILIRNNGISSSSLTKVKLKKSSSEVNKINSKSYNKHIENYTYSFLGRVRKVAITNNPYMKLRVNIESDNDDWLT